MEHKLQISQHKQKLVIKEFTPNSFLTEDTNATIIQWQKNLPIGSTVKIFFDKFASCLKLQRGASKSHTQ